jgi:hypothetical protein
VLSNTVNITKSFNYSFAEPWFGQGLLTRWDVCQRSSPTTRFRLKLINIFRLVNLFLMKRIFICKSTKLPDSIGYLDEYLPARTRNGTDSVVCSRRPFTTRSCPTLPSSWTSARAYLLTACRREWKRRMATNVGGCLPWPVF